MDSQKRMTGKWEKEEYDWPQQFIQQQKRKSEIYIDGWPIGKATYDATKIS